MAEKKKVNLRQLSKIMQVSTVTIRSWFSKGAPHERSHRGYFCDPDAVFKWREQYLSEKKQNGSEYEKARTERMLWLARQSQLNYERESGKLVGAAEVRQAAFATARQVRDSLFCIPARISPILGAISDHREINRILTKEITQCLENLSSNLNQPEVKNDAEK
ncbi:MAG: hypothetical protein E3K36_06375 [Candidatus Brocadia sp.]|nr:hypothetical protein [Candidatus Brocadia sp.]